MLTKRKPPVRRAAVPALFVLLLASCKSGRNEATPVLPGLISASAIVDVNGDGLNDVIIGSQGGGHSAPLLLLAGRDGTFTMRADAIPTQYMGVNGAAVDIQPGDFNGDDKIDLLVITVDASPATFYATARIQLFLGNGDGTFADASENITNGTYPFCLVPPASAGCPQDDWSGRWPDHVRVADLDRDGHLDFVATSSGNGRGGIIYRNDGTGHLAPASVEVTDGVVTGTFPALAWGSVHLAYDVLVGDLDGDGKVDLFAPSSGQASTHAAFINTSSPGSLSFRVVHTPVSSQHYFANGVLLDIDGDGHLDIVGSFAIASPGATAPVLAFLGDGHGGFVEDDAVLSPQPQVAHARQFLAADLTGSGREGVLIADHGYDVPPYPGARNWLLLNDGSGKLVDRTATSLDLLPGYTHQAAIGDLNGDGRPDIILNNGACNGTTTTCANEPRFWLNDGAGRFTSYSPVIK